PRRPPRTDGPTPAQRLAEPLGKKAAGPLGGRPASLMPSLALPRVHRAAYGLTDFDPLPVSPRGCLSQAQTAPRTGAAAPRPSVRGRMATLGQGPSDLGVAVLPPPDG